MYFITCFKQEKERWAAALLCCVAVSELKTRISEKVDGKDL